jgi:hypothetical protein
MSPEPPPEIPTAAPVDSDPNVPVDAPGHTGPCSKCGAGYRDDAAACPTCGLAVARMAAYTEARAAAVPEPIAEAVHVAWTRATADWNNPARHDELLQAVAVHNAYAWAAGRYRTRGRDAIAQRQLARLRHATEATLLASATARSAQATKPYRTTVGVLAILIVATAAGLWYAMVLRDPLPASGRPIPVRHLTPGNPVSPSTIK